MHLAVKEVTPQRSINDDEDQRLNLLLTNNSGHLMGVRIDQRAPSRAVHRARLQLELVREEHFAAKNSNFEFALINPRK